MARAARLTAGIAALAAALWALVGRGLVNYDTLYSLVWGRETRPGPHARPRRRARPHPASAGDPRRRPRGAAEHRERRRRARRGGADRDDRHRVPRARGARLGRVRASAAPGSTRGSACSPPRSSSRAAPVLDFGARAYVDIPYVLLVLGALLVETRRPRAGAPGARCCSRWPACSGRRRGCSRPPTSCTWCARGERGRATRLALLAALARRRRRLLCGAQRPGSSRARPVRSLTEHARHRRDARPRDGHRRGPAVRPAAARRDPARAGARRRGARRLSCRWLWLRDRVRPAIVRRRARAGRVLRARRGRPADPRPLPAPARGDRRDPLRRRRLRLAHASRERSAAPAAGDGSAC